LPVFPSAFKITRYPNRLKPGSTNGVAGPVRNGPAHSGEWNRGNVRS